MSYNIFLINTDREKARYDDISAAFHNENIDFERFKAIDGYNIKFTHQRSGLSFTGQELSVADPSRLNTYNKYTILCNPESDDPTSLNYNGFGINAGQAGLLCSNIILWNQIAQNNYQHTVILWDSAVPVSGFAQKLDNIMNNLPENYDIVYLKLNQTSGGQVAIEGNDFLNTFTSDAKFSRTQAIIVSSQAAQDFLYAYNVPFNVRTDLYYYKFSTCGENRELACAVLPQGTPELYSYVAKDVLFYDHPSPSIIDTMGSVLETNI